MKEIHVKASKVIKVTPEKVYALLADYETAHPAILPQKYFKELVVKEGGQGAGTVFSLDMEVMGVKQHFHMVVSEPENGRQLVEEDVEAGVRTSFLVEPVANGMQTQLTIMTQSVASSGIQGFFERLLNPSIMRRIFNEQLGLIAKYLEN